jgi:hypothetical protein
MACVLAIVVMGLSAPDERRIRGQLWKVENGKPVTEGIYLFSPFIYMHHQVRELVGRRDSG